jgi:ankyrin repeat protein
VTTRAKHRHGGVLITMLAVGYALPLDALALDCPAMPQQSQRDIDMAVAAAVTRIDQASATQLQAQTRTQTTDLLRRLPRADRVYLEQMMYATYCSSLRDNSRLTEAERNARIVAYNRELRATINSDGKPPAKVDPRDTARSELARLPVEYSSEAFLNSAQAGRTEVVRLFLQAGIDPNAANQRGETALIHAADRGDLSMLEMLLKAGGAAKAATRGGVTALMHAAARGDLPMLERLIKAGAAVNARTASDRETALLWATRNGHVSAMRVLLKAGASTETFADALWWAVRRGHVDAVRLMLEQGANPRSNEGDLSIAVNAMPREDPARLGEIMNGLLQRGWPVDARNDNDLTALMMAASDDNRPLVQLLLRSGADVNLHCECRAIYRGGHSALTLASFGGREEVVRLLLDAGASVDAPANDGTPLMLAAENGSAPVVKLLLGKGADPNKARDRHGHTALMSASFRRPEIASILLAAGADVNARGKSGTTALMLAAEGDQAPIARMLLDAGAQLEARDQRGRTALMVAAMSGSVDTARLLIHRGARTDVVDEDNRSALTHANDRLKGEERSRMLALLGRKDSK